MSDCMQRMVRLSGHGAKNEHRFGSARLCRSTITDVRRQSQPSAVRCPREGVPSSEANAVSTTLCGLRLDIAACIHWL